MYNVHINDKNVNGINIVHSNEITENLTPLKRAFKNTSIRKTIDSQTTEV